MENIELHPLVSAFMETTLEIMQEFLRKGQEVVPQVFMFALEDEDPVVLPIVGAHSFFETKERKAHLRPLIKNIWEKIFSSKPKLKLIAVVIFSDAWTGVASNDEEVQKMLKCLRERPSDPPRNVTEALMIQVSLSGRELQYTYPYVRGKGEIVFASKPRILESNVEDKGLLMWLWPL